jgi:hypothetical protein
MNILKTVCLFLLVAAFLAGSGCGAGSSDAGDDACNKVLEALSPSPSLSDLATSAKELNDLGCATGEAVQMVSSDNCSCEDNICVCHCGAGGDCERVGDTWYCGC